jgi:hypothetical protein
VDPNHFDANPDADPESTVTLMRIRIMIFDADPDADPDFYLMPIRIRLFSLMRIRI